MPFLSINSTNFVGTFHRKIRQNSRGEGVRPTFYKFLYKNKDLIELHFNVDFFLDLVLFNFLSATLNQNITEVSLESDATLPNDILDDKVGILDVKAKIDGHINCDIEMQVVNKKNIEKRILFYCSKMYIQSIKSGKDYSTAEKSIAILVSDYELDSLKKVEKYSSKWNFREEEYSNFILTDAIEVIIIELSKFEKYKNDTALASWVKFINNPKVIDMSNQEIRKAKKVLDK